MCFHTGDKTHKAGLYVNLRCCAEFSLGDCGAKQVGPIHMSSEVDCLPLIQRDHGPTCVTTGQKLQTAEKDVDVSTKRPVDEGAASRNANDVLMLRANPKSLEEHTVMANKSMGNRQGKGQDSQGTRGYRSTASGEESAHS